MAGSRGWVMGAPYSRWGTGKWREAWESCGATENPCLTCRDCTHPAPSPALPPHPSATRAGRGRARPEPQEGCGVEGEMRGGARPAGGQDTAKDRLEPGAVSRGALGRPKMSLFPNPQPWLRGSSSTSHNTRPRPSPLPPQITTRGREKGAIYRCRPCGCPNRAGWGGSHVVTNVSTSFPFFLTEVQLVYDVVSTLSIHQCDLTSYSLCSIRTHYKV